MPRPNSGIYVLRVFPAANPPTTDDMLQLRTAATSGNAAPAADQPAASPATAGSSPPPAEPYSDWRLVCRLAFDGLRSGPIRGSVKVTSFRRLNKAAAAANESAAAGANATDGPAPSSSAQQVTSPASLSAESCWSMDEQGHCRVTVAMQLDRMDAAAGSSSSATTSSAAGGGSGAGAGGGGAAELGNVLVTFDGTLVAGCAVGAVSLTQLIQNGSTVAMSNHRFLMKELVSARCSSCLEPLELLPSRAPDLGEYCSGQCRDAHAALQASKKQAPFLQRYLNSAKSSRCVASYDGVEFPVWWRASTPTTFTVLVDGSNPFGIAYEVRMDVLVDARRGLFISYCDSEEAAAKANVSQSDIVVQLFSVFASIVQSAVVNGCVALAATALNQLYVWCDFAEFVERQYLYFYDHCIGGGWEGQRVVSSCSDYIMLVRPLHECASVLIETALGSMTASDYWHRLETAKGVLISLYNFNGSVLFTPSVSALRTVLVPEQQRQTLLLLARVFTMMAVRTTKDHSVRMLRRAEECYRDAMEEDKNRPYNRRAAPAFVQLSALYLMFPDSGDRTKAADMREKGLQALVGVAYGGEPTSHANTRVISDRDAHDLLQGMIVAQHESNNAAATSPAAENPWASATKL